MMPSYAKIAIVTLSLVSGLASASPIAAPVPEQALEERGPNEALYLANCNQGNTQTGSVMAYYSNGKTGSQHGESPDDYAFVSNYQWVRWEGGPITGGFRSGATATSNIQAKAESYGVGSYAGAAQNSYGQVFNCYRDNNRVLYSPNGITCRSIYYCFDA